MITIEEKLKLAKKVSQEAQTKRIQLETKLENAQAKKEDLLEKCKQLGIEPDELENKIKALDKQIKAGMEKLEEILPLEKESNNFSDLDDDLPI